MKMPGIGLSWMRCGAIMLSLAGVVAMSAVTGCAGPESTRLRASDFDETLGKMIQSLSSSEFLAERSPDSPPAWVVIDKVENLTNDVIPPAEQWMLVARLQSAMPLQRFREQYRVMFQITPERHALLRQAGFTGELSTPPAITHTLSAVFMSAPRAGRDIKAGMVNTRSDYYYLEYRLVDVKTRETKWLDTFEIKQQAKGLAID